MNTPVSAGFLALALVAPGLSARAQSDATGPYHVARTFHVGGAGGWDYLTVDPAHRLLYVPRSTHTLVLSADGGATVADIPGQNRNHGVALVPAAGRGFITDGEDACVVVFDLKSHAVLGKIRAQDDADGIIYDPSTNKVLLVCGDAGVLIPISPDIDPKTGSADPAIELGGKPEFLAADGRGRVYVNLVNKSEVAVVDVRAAKVLAHWPTAPGGTPVGMAIDAAHRRLFIGCRNPQKLLVMDCDSGHILAALPLGKGNDAVQFDAPYALASCGDGTLTVAGERSPGQFDVVETLTTRVGARTAGLDATTHTLFLPTAEMEPSNGGRRPRPKPDSFMIVEVTRTR
ncbi:MAG TPA: hypothetical protein VHE61_04525 [Opitutaceae bacterium]|nr:hypothetical protein [Opitutaceae bacterium]